MKPFEPYADELDAMVYDLSRSGVAPQHSRWVTDALNGGPSTELRRVVDIAALRRAGAFFTGQKLAKTATQMLVGSDGRCSQFIDPACGAGDLLVACSDHLPVHGDVSETLRHWGTALTGQDLHPAFARAARSRLALAALLRGAGPSDAPLDLDALFPRIRAADAFSAEVPRSDVGIVVNPPFTISPAPTGCTWAQGIVSGAAVFLHQYLSRLAPGTEVVAILPEVLRTGTRYEKWRREVSALSRVRSLRRYDVFDASTDIHVFLLRLTKTAEPHPARARWWRDFKGDAVERLDDQFEIRVGPVVPHRDPHRGSWSAYLTARDLPRWETVDARNVASRRRYAGRLFTPPFLVVRRTSRPEDPERAVATLVMGDQSVAVENHLVVVRPRDGSLSQCEEGMKVLRSPHTTSWLNERLRCRHLTVTALRQLPLWRPDG